VQFANNGPNVGLTWDINRGKPGPNHRIDGTDIPTPPGDDDPDPPPPPPPDPNLPGAPGHLSGYTSGTSTINLTWSDNANNETGYQVELLSADGVTWLVVGTLAADVKTFQMTQLTSGQPYTFRVRAFNSYGFSDPSNQALIKMPLPDNSTTQAPNTNTTRQTRPALSQQTGTTSILPTVISDV
jgi:titin